MKHTLISLAILVWIALATPTLGEAELVLIDGRVLRGNDVRRGDGLYTLLFENGSEATFPQELVDHVRLLADEDDDADERDQKAIDEMELTRTPIPAGPSGLRHAVPETLAGVRADAPTTAQQRGTLGEAARFQKDIVDNTWTPSSDWEMDPENNNFAPSTWSKGVIDPTWKPESAFDADKDVMKNSRSTWSKSVVDSSWQPTDGFAKHRRASD